MAGALRAELKDENATLRPPVGDVDLLDQLLALDVPVGDPEARPWLNLQDWAARDGRRDLLALAADTRFREVFRSGCPTYEREGIDKRTVARLAESPGGRPMLAEWVAGVSRGYLTCGLGDFALNSGPFQTLNWLPGEILATAEQEVRDALGTGMAPVLGRALRNGLLDELGWPAWDEAIGSSASPEQARATQVAEAWPHLVVLQGTHARVLGAQGTVLSHQLRLPDEQGPGSPDVRYVDGALLVSWYVSATSTSYGYWYHPDTGVSPTTELTGDVRSCYSCHADGSGGTNGMPPASLPLSGGGRTTGHGVLRPGDTHVPWRRRVIGDGTSHWVWIDDWSREKNSTWHAYEPADDTAGERGGPDWFAEGLRAAPEGSTLGACWLLPAPSAEPGPVCAPVDGLLGWRVIIGPDGSRHGQDLAGHSVVVPRRVGGSPENALVFPGTDRAVTVMRWSSDLQLRDSDQAVLAHFKRDQTAGPFSAGTPCCRPCATGTCSGPATRRAPRRSAGSATTSRRSCWRRPSPRRPETGRRTGTRCSAPSARSSRRSATRRCSGASPAWRATPPSSSASWTGCSPGWTRRSGASSRRNRGPHSATACSPPR